jgi:hypothetical protein
MSDTPDTAPEANPEPALKPKLTLTPKAPASAPAPEGAAPPPVSTLQAASSGTPASLLAAKAGAPRASLKLQDPANSKIETVNAPVFQSPMPVAASDSPSIVVVLLSFIAAAAAITFAVLLYLKNQ